MELSFGRLRVHPGFFILCSVIILSPGGALPITAAIAVHEAGHAAAMLLTGVRIIELQLSFGGIGMVYDDGRVSYAAEALCAAAGPAASFISALIAGKLFSSDLAYVFSGACIVLLLFNMLPISYLDGGRMARAFISYIAGPDAADGFFLISDTACILILLSFSIVSVILRGSVSAAAITVTACIFLYCKNRSAGVKSL